MSQARIVPKTDPGLDFFAALGLGGLELEVKFGKNSDVDIGTEDVICQGGTQEIIAAGGAQLAVKSSNINDDGDPVGTGARTVTIYYLDANYERQTETVTLDGTTLKNTIASDILRPYRMVVATAGAQKINLGDITLENTGGTLVYLHIMAQEGQTQTTFFTVPLGYRAFIIDWTVTSSITNIATFNFNATAIAGAFLDGIFLTKRTVVLAGGAFTSVMGPLVFPEKTDLIVEVTATGDNTYATSSYRMVLVPT